jgi:hypothetical protein
MRPDLPRWTLEAVNKEATAMSDTRSYPAGGAIYGLGIFGAWVYFFQQADGFWEFVLAFIQGIFWPAWMVYDVFQALAR